MAKKHYAWSNLYNGGETRKVGDRKIVVKRHMVPFGEEVTKAKLKCSDEDWDRMVENGSIRAYPVPKGLPENQSPANFVLEGLLSGKQEIPQEKLVELALANAVLVDEEESELAEA